MKRTTIVRTTWVGTALFVVSAVAAVARAEARPVAAALALALFVTGIAAFAWAYAIAVGRSRTDAIGIGGLFFLSGRETAPRGDKLAILGALGAQTVTALATAAARPFTSLAFGVLVPLFGLAMAGLYGARHGRFGARVAKG